MTAIRKVMIVAAEASSSLYATRLLEYWKKTEAGVEAFGIGSQEMERLGFDRIGKAEELAVMGLVEVLRHWPLIKSTFYQLVEEANTRRPDVVILMDYPDFNLRLAKRLKRQGLRVVYYIAPQVWAWRKRRVHAIKKYVDHVIVLFPFELEFYQRFGVPSSFVGHPLLDEMRDELKSADYFKMRREKLGLAKAKLVVGLMPGSRHGELEHHLTPQFEVAERLYQKNRNLSFVLPVAPTLNLEQVRSQLPDYKFPLKLIQDEPFSMIGLMDVMLVASGTATLMVGLMHVPMIVMYRFSPLTVFLARPFIQRPRFFCIVNLIFDRLVVPEFFQEEATVDRLTSEMEKLIEDTTVRQTQRAMLQTLDSKLGNVGATRRVAELLNQLKISWS